MLEHPELAFQERKTMSTYTPIDVRTDASNSTELLTGRELSVADTGGGLLVFASVEDGIGREPVAFADVADWSVIRSALQHGGLGVGAMYHLPVVRATDLIRILKEGDD